jgi:hypothetical protein
MLIHLSGHFTPLFFVHRLWSAPDRYQRRPDNRSVFSVFFRFRSDAHTRTHLTPQLSVSQRGKSPNKKLSVSLAVAGTKRGQRISDLGNLI